MSRKAIVVAVGILLAPVGAAVAQDLRVAPYVSGLAQPVGLVADPSDPTRQFVVEKGGRVRVIERGVLRAEPALDISGVVASDGEQGLLGLAVDPHFRTTGRIWVDFTRASDGATVVARFTRAAGDPLRFDVASRFDLRFADQPAQRFITQPAANHNGGKLLFLPDGTLLVAMGDGGGGNDTYRTAQDPQQLLGKLLRIDVSVPDVAGAPLEQRVDAERGYRVPPDNPFVDGVPIAARQEIWAFGVRNPWRVTVDDPVLGGTGALLIADVGQSAREEVDYEPAGSGGGNYGWPLMEGTLVNASAPSGVTGAYPPLVAPVHEYGRTDGVSITGGYVYRGRLLGNAFVGRYVYGDLSNRLRSIALTVPAAGPLAAGDVREHTTEVGGLSGGLVSIDADTTGELYLVMLSGAILRLTTTADADGDGVDDAWAAQTGLAGLPADTRGPYGDPDGDGVTNAREFRDGGHPLQAPVGYFGEGANGFFATNIALLNEQDTPLPVALRFPRSDGVSPAAQVVVPPRRSLAIDTRTVAGLAQAEFGATIEAARTVPALRTMTWPVGDGEAYGSHADHAIAAPRTRWYFAEGATTSFELFLLLANPTRVRAQIRVDYLLQGQAPIARAYVVEPESRLTIWVNQEPGLDRAELGAVVTSENGVAVLAERAMYTRGGAAPFAAGHVAAGEPAVATRWVFAEGSTSAWFETFVTIVNPGDAPLPIVARVRVQEPGAPPLQLTREVPARSRATLWLDRETSDDGVPLGGRDGISVELTADAGFVAERVMWWPGDAAGWYEAHVAAGFSEPPAATWRLAGGSYESHPGDAEPREQSWVLLANVGAATETVTVTVYLADREPMSLDVDVAADARLSVPLSALLDGSGVGEAMPAVTGVVVQAHSPSAQLYAEQATYGSTTTQRWARGSAARGVR